MDFKSLVIQFLYETTAIGGVDSVMGSGVMNTATSRSGDNYAPGDARMPKSIYGGVLTRGGMKSVSLFKKKKRKKRKKR